MPDIAIESTLWLNRLESSILRNYAIFLSAYPLGLPGLFGHPKSYRSDEGCTRPEGVVMYAYLTRVFGVFRPNPIQAWTPNARILQEVRHQKGYCLYRSFSPSLIP
jgi:hypothetical protein